MTSQANNTFNLRSDDGSDSSEGRSEYSSPATTPNSVEDIKDSTQNDHVVPNTSEEQHADPHHPVESRSNSGIKDDLWLMHADEIVSLAQKKTPVMNAEDNYGAVIRKVIGNYFHHVFFTWVRCAWSILVLPSSKSVSNVRVL